MTLSNLWLLAQGDAGGGGADAAAAGVGIVGMLIYLLIVALLVASMWKVFAKAGKPGWAAIIPIYNSIVWVEIVGKPIWWFVLLFIPCVGVIIAIILCIELAKVFGKGAGFGLGIAFLPFIFLPMLAFSDAQYTAPPPPA